jgi:hypothetical protein
MLQTDLLTALVGDPLRAIARLLADDDRFRMRLACRTMRDHAEPMTAPISRVAFLSARSLVAYACDELPGFMPPVPQRMLGLAATVGCVDVLAERTDARGCACGPGLDHELVCSAAAAHGQLEALVWLRGRGCSWSKHVCSSAARAGHLEVLRYAHEHGCPWDEQTCSSAAIGGHLEVLQYAHEHGCPSDEYTCTYAAMGGHLEVLQYAHEHGCPWDELTCAHAARGGHLEMLRYAHEHGCPWDELPCAHAARGGHLEMLRYYAIYSGLAVLAQCCMRLDVV